MVFPTSNLPTVSQTWGREVQKRIENAEKTAVTNEINNVARDAQLASSYRRLDAAVISAQAAIDGLGSLDQSTSTYKINADNLTAGTITGLTVRTSAGSNSVRLSGSDNALVVKTDGTDKAFLTAGYNGTYGYGATFGIAGANAETQTGTYHFMAPDTHVLWTSGGVIYADEDGTGVAGNGFYSSAGYNSFDDYVVMSNGADITGDLGVSGTITAGGSIIRTALIGAATTGASITAGGALVRTSSSARYKQDIADISFNYEDILALQPKKFRIKDDVLHNEDAPYHVGFVAEELAGTPLDIFVNYKKIDEEMVPDGIQYLGMTAMLLAAIKHQDTLIKNLSTEIDILKGA